MVPHGTTFIRWFSELGSKGGIVFAHPLPAFLPDAQDLNVRLTRAVGAVRTFVREAACSVRGHDHLLHASDHRIYLRCADCGRETPGWRIDAKVAPRTTGRR
jgi:hypothetical protein